jgi:hemerythrin superfamily protein
MAAAGAVGLVAGLAANFGRKALVQGAESLAGDWVDVLKAEHLMVIELFDKVEETQPDQKTRRAALLSKIKYALSKHALQEENAVYPAMRQADPEGAAEKLFHDHAEIKTYLYELETMPKDDPQWLPRLRAFRRLIEEHVREEEDVVFPAFRETMSEEQNAKLTALMHKEGFKLA